MDSVPASADMTMVQPSGGGQARRYRPRAANRRRFGGNVPGTGSQSKQEN